MMNEPIPNDLNRRDFLRGGSFATLMTLLGGVELRAQDKPKDPDEPTKYRTIGPPVKCGVIGCGLWGREVINTLGKLPNAPVVAVCDPYEAFLRRAKDAAPNAKTFTDYTKLLEDKDVQAVVIATPSHKHKDVVLAALKAGKHVYCEAPLAHTVEDARAIAQAAKAASKSYFQAGLQYRADPQRSFLLEFIRSGAMGRNLKARSQWHKKQSWRRTAPSPEREREINWRLTKTTSPGLLGELGVHQVDVANWFLGAMPVAVTGYGGIVHWKDGRDVPDAVQAVFEYPGHIQFNCEVTLANSFDGEHEMFYGTDAAIMTRGNKAWLFKEVDSPLLGWEVYARKDLFYKETGIALVANASKLAGQGDQGGDDVPYASTTLQFALESFVANSNSIGAGVEDFTTNFGDDPAGLKDFVAGLAKNLAPHAGWKEGFAATVYALKANEAVLKHQRIEFQKEWFEV
jgi:predicted dehydrogenase